jgi:hypothetical protein
MTAAVPPTTAAVSADRVREGFSPAMRDLTVSAAMFNCGSLLQRFVPTWLFPFVPHENRRENALKAGKGAWICDR